jgi:hypothetical protein
LEKHFKVLGNAFPVFKWVGLMQGLLEPFQENKTSFAKLYQNTAVGLL